MSLYKMRQLKIGIRYSIGEMGVSVNGEEPKAKYKFVAEADIPLDILALLSFDNEVDSEQMPVDKSCVFCEGPSKMSRMVNGQTVYICDTHYYDKTIGQVAAQINLLKAGA